MNHQQKAMNFRVKMAPIQEQTAPQQVMYKRNRARPLLLSSDNMAQIAMERSKLNILKRLSQIKIIDGIDEMKSNYAVTRDRPQVAPTFPKPQSPQKKVIKAYPIMQSLRFNPTVIKASPSTTHSRVNFNEQETYVCSCLNCQKYNSPLYRTSCMDKGISSRNNIMSFTDQATMTSRVTDACCEADCTKKINAPADPEAAVRDDCEYYSEVPFQCIPSQYVSPKTTPIRKSPVTSHIRSCLKCEETKPLGAPSFAEDDYEYPELDSGIKYYKNNFTVADAASACCVSGTTSHGWKKNKRENRMKIYDEGIDDAIASAIPANQEDAPKCCKSRCVHCCRTTKKSKYHQNCARHTKRYRGVERRELDCGKVCRRIKCQAPCSNEDEAPIKLPRRVVTSERNIEEYISKSCHGYDFND